MSSCNIETLNELFLRAMEQRAKEGCFLVKRGGKYQPVSSRAAYEKTAALACSLDRLGVRRGDRVALLSENRLEWALTDYAILGLGAITVPLYPTLPEPDVEYILRDSAARVIVVSTDLQLKKVQNVRARLPELRAVIVMDHRFAGEGNTLPWDDLAREEQSPGLGSREFFSARAREARPEDIATLLYTSGTMGVPKGVVLTHSNIVSNLRASADLLPMGTRDVGMSFLPLAHIFERTLDYHYLNMGVTIAYAESYEALPQNLLEVRPTVMAVVPRVLEKVHDRIMEKVRSAPAAMARLFYWALGVGGKYYPYQLAGRRPPVLMRLKRSVADWLVFRKISRQMGGRLTMIISGAAPLSPSLIEFLFSVGLPVYEGYGLTETSPIISVNCPGATKIGTVGRPIPGVEVRIGEPEDDSQAGEILVRGPNVTPGYYHLDEENRRAFVDGWFHTGDLGRLDSDGFLIITGRKKNLFKTSGGKYVSPEKLESLFQGHPYIAQMVVLGDGRKFIGGVVVPNFARLEAYARSRGIHCENRADLVANPLLHQFMQEQVDEACDLLAPHERIRQIVLLPRELSMAEGELSATLKVKRRVIEERFRAQIEEMFQRHAPVNEQASAARP